MMDELEKKRLFWAKITALATVSILVIVLITGIGLFAGMSALQDDFVKMGQMVDQMDTLTVSLAEVSDQLVRINWEELAANINETAEKAQFSMDAAIQAIDDLDIDTLNEAIANLRDVIEPLAAFFNVFR